MQRNFYTLVGIVMVVLLAIIVDVSGTGPYTINLWHPVKVVQGLDLQGGARVMLKAMPAPGQKLTDGDMEATRNIIEMRVNGGFGVSEPVIQTVQSNGLRYISVELPGLTKNLQSVEKVLQTTGQLTLVANGSVNLPKGASTKGYPLLAKGTDIIASSVAVGTDTLGAPAVDFDVSGAVAGKIGDYTATHVGGFMAIAIDNKVYDDPTIQSAIPGGHIQITNVGSIDNAKALQTTLKYGALPVPLKIVGVQQVSASLGPANVRASVLAGIVGLIIVILFMAFYYRLPGLLADCALLIYALVVFAAFKLIPVTLTLAGIAGFILGIGMAVDANILIFERMKEELRGGRSIGAATDAGFARAWPSIRDSNISTMITCAILYWFGNNFAASIIVGFATTLFIGVVISMLTAILVSRTFLRLVLAGTRITNRRLFGADMAPAERSAPTRGAIDLLKYRYVYLAISALIIVPGLIFMGLGGLKPGIDFKGGTEVTVLMPKGVTTTTSAVESIVKTVSYTSAKGKPQRLDDNQAQLVSDARYPGQQEYLIRVPDIGSDVTAQNNLIAALRKSYNNRSGAVQSLRFDSVGGTIATDTTTRAIEAVLAAAVAILLYMAWAFRKLPHPFVYGGAAIAALLHDVLVVLGLFAIMGFFFNVRIDSLFVPAVLTVIGFSVHDTIVVFDRIRENMGRRTGEPYYTVVNNSLAQTLGRSLNTSLTVLLTLTALLLFGGESIRTFVLALLIGITSGTYSSIFNATPLAVIWEMGELPGLFGGGKKGATSPPPRPRPVPARRTGTAR